MLEHFYLSMLLFLTSLGIIAIVFMSKIKLLSKLVIAILLTVSGIFTYRALNEIRGYPVVLQASFKDTLIVSHLPDTENKVIHLWIKAKEDKSPRSYTVPFKKKLAKFLEGMRRKHKGKPYRVKIKTKSNQTSPLGQSVKELEVGELMVFPPKRPSNSNRFE